jgi:hypothetical protein
MSESPDGKEVLNLLNYDRWIVPDEEILGHLE